LDQLEQEIIDEYPQNMNVRADLSEFTINFDLEDGGASSGQQELLFKKSIKNPSLMATASYEEKLKLLSDTKFKSDQKKNRRHLVNKT